MQDLQTLMEAWAVEFHEKGTREAAFYHDSLKQAFPSVHSVASMHSGVFAACFDLFLDAVSKYEEYKAKSEKAKENAINRLKAKE